MSSEDPQKLMAETRLGELAFSVLVKLESFVDQQFFATSVLRVSQQRSAYYHTMRCTSHCTVACTLMAYFR